MAFSCTLHMQGLPRSSLLLHLLLFQLQPARNLPSACRADIPAFVLKGNIPNSPQFFDSFNLPMNAEHFPFTWGISSGKDAKKLSLPEGLCSSFTAAALQHPACDPAAPVLSGSCNPTNPKGAQSSVSSQGGIRAAAPVQGQPFATHSAHTAAVTTPA